VRVLEDEVSEAARNSQLPLRESRRGATHPTLLEVRLPAPPGVQRADRYDFKP
jgi:hypothetical protein